MESTPNDLTKEKLERLRSIGVDRLSIGVQSFDPDQSELVDQAYDALVSRFPEHELTRVRGFLDHISGRVRPSFHRFQSTQVPPLHFPGLPPAPFLDRSLFEEASELERAFEAIRQESAPLLAGTDRLVQYERGDKPEWPRWKKLVFYDSGPHARVDDNCRTFPVTSGVIDRVVGRYEDFLSAGFLVHDGQVAIKPHVDWFNVYISLWLPIYVPEGCGVEAGGERQELVEGECIAFDNTYRHSTWNNSDSPRIVVAVYRLTPHLTKTETTAFIYLKKQHGQFWLRRMRESEAAAN